MMMIRKFVLKNFKGIETVELDVIDRTNCPVLTLIGLNESGKATILEGLSHFVSGDRSVSGLFGGVHALVGLAGGFRVEPGGTTVGTWITRPTAGWKPPGRCSWGFGRFPAPPERHDWK